MSVPIMTCTPTITAYYPVLPGVIAVLNQHDEIVGVITEGSTPVPDAQELQRRVRQMLKETRDSMRSSIANQIESGGGSNPYE